MEITDPVTPLHFFTDSTITFWEDTAEVIHQIQTAAERDSETKLNFYDVAQLPYFHVYNLQII